MIVESLPTAYTTVGAFEAFLFDCEAKGLAEGTIRYYKRTLDRFRAYLEECGVQQIAELTSVHVRGHFQALREAGVSMAGIHAHARGVRTLLHWLDREEAISVSVVRRFRMPKNDEKLVEPLEQTEVRALLSTAQAVAWRGRESRMEERDTAIVLLLADTGMRSGELINLKLSDVQGNRVILRKTKTHRPRIVPISDRTREAIEAWVRKRQILLELEPRRLDRTATIEEWEAFLAAWHDRFGDELTAVKEVIEEAKRPGIIQEAFALIATTLEKQQEEPNALDQLQAEKATEMDRGAKELFTSAAAALATLMEISTDLERIGADLAVLSDRKRSDYSPLDTAAISTMAERLQQRMGADGQDVQTRCEKTHVRKQGALEGPMDALAFRCAFGDALSNRAGYAIGRFCVEKGTRHPYTRVTRWRVREIEDLAEVPPLMPPAVAHDRQKWDPEEAGEWLFLARTGHHLPRYAITSLFRRLAKAAGIEHAHPHQMRHSAATEWVRAGGNPLHLQRLMGWTTGAMIQRYARIADEDVVESHREIDLVGRLTGVPHE